MENRIIKFRAWDSHHKTIINWEDQQHWDVATSQEANQIYLQYTGLKDCKGVDIYEGDIIKYSLPDYDGSVMTEYTEVVEFKDGMFQLEVMPVYAAVEEEAGGEIIGNIYENPELLK